MSKQYHLIFALILAGCIAPSAPAEEVGPMCLTDVDCDMASGEICDEGLCWGNPPAQAYAALLIPPADEGEQQSSLVPTELPRLEIAADGTIRDLAFVAPITLRGRVVLPCGEGEIQPACETARSIGAQILVKRPSRIPGGPPYILRVDSQVGVEHGSSSFVLRLPPSEPGGRYEVTIVPSHQTDPGSGLVPAEVAPPLRFELEPTRDQDGLLWIVGDPAQHVVLEGRVVDAVGMGIPDRRVFALPNADTLAVAERRSSLSTTDGDGIFTLRVPRDVLTAGGIDLVVEPMVAGTAPVLRVSNVPLPESALLDGVVELTPLKMPTYGELRTFTLPVRGIDGGGGVVPIPAAEVRIKTLLYGDDPSIEATFTNLKFTDNGGDAQIELIPGSEVENRRYLVHVLPPADTEHVSLYEHEIDIGSTQGGVLAPVILDRRVPVTGTLLTAQGEPAVGTTVAATLSVGFRWSLDHALRQQADALQLPKDVTDQSGGFVMWLEESLLGVPAAYDLGMQPTDRLAPPWVLREIDTSQRDQSGTVHLGTTTFPRAAHVRGVVLSPAKEPVAGAEVRLYELAEDQTLCTTTDWPGERGAECLVPPRYQGPTRSGEGGKVTLVLPDPSM